jgi:nucleoside-diphosphate-sugar epimerase
MNKSIAIVGCGWLGFPFAKQMVAKGWKVVGTTTTPEKLELLRATGIESYLMQVNQPPTEEIYACDAIFLNIPPGLRKAEKPEEEEQRFLSHMEACLKPIIAERTHLIAASSTSVYPDWNIEMDTSYGGMGEASGVAGTALRVFEGMCWDMAGPNTTILRFAGLYGADRHTVKFFAGRKNISGGMQRVNMVSLERCLDTLEQVVQRPIMGEVMNVVDPEHLSRKEFYSKAALEKDLPLPEFDEDGHQVYGKCII